MSESKDPRKKELKTHTFDFTPTELVELKALFPEFKQPKHVNKHKVQGLEIEELRKVLLQKLPIEAKAVDRIISRIDRQYSKKIMWAEFLNSLTEEGKIREIVADAQLYGFGVKRLQFKESNSLKTNDDDKMAEYYIHKMVVVKFEKTPLILAFFED